MPPKRVKKEQEPDDEFMQMVASQLQNELNLSKSKVSEIKSKRNYIQMDRDMVEQFYHNTELQIQQVQTDILNKEADAQNMQINHNTEVKVFLQKLKLLEYEQQKVNIYIEEDGEQAKGHENKYYEDHVKNMKKNKHQLKKDLGDDEIKYIEKTQILKKDHQTKEKYMRDQNDNHLIELERKYQQKLSKMKEQLQLKQKVQVHELEERKNLHINELMKNHEEAFAQLKNYYNQITRDNLKLIKDHKAEIKKINEQSQRNKKKIAELRDSNNEMKEPLKKLGMERDKLKSLLRQFEKHKMSKQNYKNKLLTLREKVRRMQKQFGQLTEQYDKVVMDKKDLTMKFQKLTHQVKKHAETYNVVLMRKMETQIQELQQKQAQLHHLMESVGLEPKAREQIKIKVKQTLDKKNNDIKNLKYSINHATKAYNDAIRVYEAKLVQFGIPSQQLGFQPLQTITSTMPAGLVSS